MGSYGRDIQSDTITVRRGNIVPITFRFKEPDGSDMDLTGKTIVFRAAVDGIVIRKNTGGGGLDMPTPTNGEVTCTLSAADTRSIPPGKAMPFEVENFTEQVTIEQGSLIPEGGTNDD